MIEHKQFPSRKAFKISDILGYRYAGACLGYVIVIQPVAEANQKILKIKSSKDVDEVPNPLRFELSDILVKKKWTGNCCHLVSCTDDEVLEIDYEEGKELACIAGKLFTPRKGGNGGCRS